MVELLERKQNIEGGPTGAAKALSGMVRAVRKDILTNGKFVALDGSLQQGTYMQPPTIINSLQTLLLDQSQETKAAKNARRIVSEGWIKLYGSHVRSQQQRRSAVNTLLKLSERRKNVIKKAFTEQLISKQKFMTLLGPVEGTIIALKTEKRGSI